MPSKTVGDPCEAWENAQPFWVRNRAFTSCDMDVKVHDEGFAYNPMDNRAFLIPFSPQMTTEQYRFFIKEAELPGITAQYEGMIRGGLLRKQPLLTTPPSIPEEGRDWILNRIAQDESTLLSFLEEVIYEELRTDHTWIQVDYPRVLDPEAPPENARPYPVVWPAENVINWNVSRGENGRLTLQYLIIKTTEKRPSNTPFHPEDVEVVYIHMLNDSGKYEIHQFRREGPDWIPEGVIPFLVNDEQLSFIPIWPVSGILEPGIPFLTVLVDREMALYNKVARRNHLLYGAATYTPWLRSDMSSEQFDQFVASGLGTWLQLRSGEELGVLETPTAALADLDRSISSSVEEMAKLGVRMMTEETAQSGVALQLRNATQTAQLGSLNTRLSNTMKQIITFMLSWQYDLDLRESDVSLVLNDDFDKTTFDAQWMRLITEWYENGLIPRSIWLNIVKANEVMPPDYNDEDGRKEIEEHRDLITPPAPPDFLNRGFE